ncbi:M48 family metallopeptidase [Thermophagus xiamenensis]|uniref:STE24 endopeptidase n=1 Tax=Thermophagus xiamenensis TaxID=385682 RepID=A0A1I2EAQ7_9BACT|nr:M48 family metallopeptidase [Thermophagus xiamenensis]SFE89763.1 STE24 endopeptidase [Thermophagus xiamenensis]
MHTTLFYVIIGLLLADALWGWILEELNRRSWAESVPDRLADVYPQDKFEKQKQYRRVNHRFGKISSTFSLVVLLVFLWFHGFALVDNWVLQYTDHWLWRPLIFFGIMGLASYIIGLPFDIYQTFVIEERFGFNKTTPKTFVSDQIKSLVLGAVIGGILLSLVIWFYHFAGKWFWLYAWVGLSLFMIFISKFYTTLILPLFNKQTPLEEGPLRKAIEEMSQKAGFALENVYVMDGSKRSTKANAFFSGFGKNKRIVLFDTLINDLEINEIVAVLAHEIGHYRLKHIIWGTILSVLQTGLTLYLLGWFVNEPALSQALGINEPVFHIGLIGFAILYSPVSEILGLGMNIFSRRNEFQADAFAGKHADAAALQSALKKISANALSNPTPHPWYVFFNYSHPPLLKRLEALDKVD